MNCFKKTRLFDENIFLAKKNKQAFSSSLSSSSTNKNISSSGGMQIGQPDNTVNYVFGKKRYELGDWLGNVRVVVNDRKTQALQGNTVVGYTAQTLSVSDYYPFGFEIAERSYSLKDYRFGYNTQEHIFELNKDHYTALFWKYD